MKFEYCSNCKQKTGFKRSLGFGTFFAVLLTGGFWILAIPFYPTRCISCGSARGGAEPTEISGSRILWLFLTIIGVLMMLYVLGALVRP